MTEQDDMDLKRAMDALPRAIEPPDNLWLGVRGRLTQRARAPVTRLALDTVPRAPLITTRLAALLACLAISTGALAYERHAATQWELYTSTNGRWHLRSGDSIETTNRWTAVRIGTIGTVEATMGTRMRVLETSFSRQRLLLTRGTIAALIHAPPKVFIVETPTGTATDMGCEYSLSVDSDGTSRLHVTLGWVEMEHGGRSLIPAGMHVVSRRDVPVGTPVRDDASAELQRSVDLFDATSADSALLAVLKQARAVDAVTLWHLVGRTGGTRRTLVVGRLLGLVPLPAGVRRDELEHNNYAAMSLYWTALPGTLPIIPSWQAALWKLWLQITG